MATRAWPEDAVFLAYVDRTDCQIDCPAIADSAIDQRQILAASMHEFLFGGVASKVVPVPEGELDGSDFRWRTVARAFADMAAAALRLGRHPMATDSEQCWQKVGATGGNGSVH